MKSKDNIIDFKSIGAMLCKKKLTKEQEKDVEEFNRQYEKAHDEKEEKGE